MEVEIFSKKVIGTAIALRDHLYSDVEQSQLIHSLKPKQFYLKIIEEQNWYKLVSSSVLPPNNETVNFNLGYIEIMEISPAPNAVTEVRIVEYCDDNPSPHNLYSLYLSQYKKMLIEDFKFVDPNMKYTSRKADRKVDMDSDDQIHSQFSPTSENTQISSGEFQKEQTDHATSVVYSKKESSGKPTVRRPRQDAIKRVAFAYYLLENGDVPTRKSAAKRARTTTESMNKYKNYHPSVVEWLDYFRKNPNYVTKFRQELAGKRGKS